MNHEMRLTDWQKSKFCSIVLLGCERSTACDYVGAVAAQFQAELELDPAFARAVARAEAEAELRHMGNVHRAAQDEKNWRTSVWWLEQRYQERAGATSSLTTDAHLAELVDDVAMAIVEEVPDVNVQRRLIERLRRILAGDEKSPGIVIDSLHLLPAPVSEATASPEQEANESP